MVVTALARFVTISEEPFVQLLNKALKSACGREKQRPFLFLKKNITPPIAGIKYPAAVARADTGGYEKIEKTYRILYNYSHDNGLVLEKEFFEEETVDLLAVKTYKETVVRISVKVLE